jgi:GH18 family chitinase
VTNTLTQIGVDIDWEYPGGNGEDYKQIENSEKEWEIEAYPKLLSEIRSALGPDKLMSAAVPGLRRDMLAFTKDTVPKISASLDFFNIMTYDLMNRRDNITKHHTGVELSLDAIDAYLENGVPPQKANLGFAFYVKWFKTDPQGSCTENPVGCRTVLMEDPLTGRDLGQAGAFSWHDTVPSELEQCFKKALKEAKYDDIHGGELLLGFRGEYMVELGYPRSRCSQISVYNREKGLRWSFCLGSRRGCTQVDTLESFD